MTFTTPGNPAGPSPRNTGESADPEPAGAPEPIRVGGRIGRPRLEAALYSANRILRTTLAEYLG